MVSLPVIRTVVLSPSTSTRAPSVSTLIWSPRAVPLTVTNVDIDEDVFALIDAAVDLGSGQR